MFCFSHVTVVRFLICIFQYCGIAVFILLLCVLLGFQRKSPPHEVNLYTFCTYQKTCVSDFLPLIKLFVTPELNNKFTSHYICFSCTRIISHRMFFFFFWTLKLAPQYGPYELNLFDLCLSSNLTIIHFKEKTHFFSIIILVCLLINKLTHVLDYYTQFMT